MKWRIVIIRPPREVATVTVSARDRVAACRHPKLRAALRKHNAIRYRIFKAK